MITPKFPTRRRAAEVAAVVAKPTPTAPTPPPPQRAARIVAPARPAPPQPASPLPPTPKKTLEEVRATESAARARQRRRRADRAVEELAGREREVVAVLLEATGGNGWPWPRHVHKLVAERLGAGTFAARSYLSALRRTLGLPVLAGYRKGPMLMSEAWRKRAEETGDFGIFAPLRPPEALRAAE